ncbi:MAG: SRPBCC family protein [Candidatus Odyssella sp.]|nr:SRPBCC family protein [Candidatus Odyssella sp.]
MRIEGSFVVAAPRERVFAEITNPALMAGCIPGCEAIEVIDPKTYRARILVEVGPIKARFNLVVEVKEEVPPERVVSITRGEEGTRASVISSNNELVLAPAEGGGTEVKYVAEVSVTGRLGKFGLGMMKKKAEALGAKFAENFRGKIEAAAAS